MCTTVQFNGKRKTYESIPQCNTNWLFNTFTVLKVLLFSFCTLHRKIRWNVCHYLKLILHPPWRRQNRKKEFYELYNQLIQIHMCDILRTLSFLSFFSILDCKRSWVQKPLSSDGLLINVGSRSSYSSGHFNHFEILVDDNNILLTRLQFFEMQIKE